MTMLAQKRRKITVSVTLSPNLINQLDELLDTGEFSGQSDIVSQALSEFFTHYHDRKRRSELRERIRPGPGYDLDRYDDGIQELMELLNQEGAVSLLLESMREAKKKRAGGRRDREGFC